MSFKIITRGAPRPVRADFRCPVHGVFTALVDSGTESVLCPREHERKGILLTAFGHICNQVSPWSPSLIPMRMARAQATTGKSDAPEHRDWDFTRNLEEGQDPDEWEADREAAAERRREQFVYDAVRED